MAIEEGQLENLPQQRTDAAALAAGGLAVVLATYVEEDRYDLFSAFVGFTLVVTLFAYLIGRSRGWGQRTAFALVVGLVVTPILGLIGEIMLSDNAAEFFQWAVPAEQRVGPSHVGGLFLVVGAILVAVVAAISDWFLTTPSAAAPLDQDKSVIEPLENWSGDEEAAEHRKERKRLSENHYNRAYSLVAWLLATLVAVNGGAVVAVLSIEESGQDGGRLPVIAFSAGVMLAIVSGFCSWREAYHKSKLYYFESLREDQLTPAARSHRRIARFRGKWLGTAASQTNYGSLLAFIVGCLWAAYAYL